MAGIQDLIDIQFQDLTGYAENDNTDVLGTLFAHYWGPTTEIPMVYSRQTFFQAFPEVLPYNPDGLSHSIREYMSLYALRSYAQIKKAFDLGMGYAEVKNVNNLNRFVIVSSSSSGWITDQAVKGLSWAIALKYKGLLPSTLVGSSEGTLAFKVTQGNDKIVNIYIGLASGAALNESTDPLLEEWHGALVPETFVDGQDIYLGKLLEGSQFLTFIASDNWDGSSTVIATTTLSYTLPDSVNRICNLDTSLDVDEMNFFSDINRSHTTLLINPFTIVGSEDISAVTQFDTKISVLASDNKTMNAVRGLHTEELQSSWQPLTYKFTFKVEGIEYVTVFGAKVTLNCVGGWCGATAKVARDVRLNQLASAQSYGSYEGVLVKTQNFDTVLEAHKKGVISVYATDNGPQIFGVRAFLSNQNTYFAKANVMRVIASYLKNLIPLVMDAIHTDASANPVTRRVLSSRMNSVCDDFIGNQNMKPGSYIDISDALNNDYDTKGGEILIVVAVCYFIKLIEKVTFKIIATDSSVRVEFNS